MSIRNIENRIEREPAENEPKTCQELLEEFERKLEESKQKEKFWEGEKLPLNGKPEKDVYNITAPFEDEGNFYIAARVEKREENGKSKIAFFKKENGIGELDESKLEFDGMEDPFVTKIDNELMFGGVEISPSSTPEHPEWLEYKTVFYKGKNINELKKFAEGPEGMKDIRLIELSNGEILVFTRSEEKTGEIDDGGWPKNIKKIGFTKINSLDNFNPDIIQSAKEIEGQFAKDEWGGTNELHLLKNGKIGILGHIARCDDEGNRHYYATAFCFDPETEESSPLKIIAIRENFPAGDARKDDLKDVIFSGGIVRNENGTADLFCGLSDVDAGRITISDPFTEYEIE